MKLALAKTLWGVEGAFEPSQWAELFARIKSEGFDAVEVPATLPTLFSSASCV